MSFKFLPPRLLALSLFLPLSVQAFSDITTDTQYSTAINYLQENGILKGYSDGTFRPTASINRAEFIKIITQAVYPEFTLNRCETDNFTDVSEDAWYAPYICVAKRPCTEIIQGNCTTFSQSLINGYSDGTFRPAQEISLAEAAKILTLGFNYEVTANTETWYKPYIEILESQNALPPSLTGFSASLTRGEMAEMIYRLSTKDLGQKSLSYAILSQDEPKTADYSDELVPSTFTLYNDQTDSVYVTAEKPNGDLLSTLIADTARRQSLSLELFSPKYLAYLKTILNAKTQALFSSDLQITGLKYLNSQNLLLSGLLNNTSYLILYYQNEPLFFSNLPYLNSNNTPCTSTLEAEHLLHTCTLQENYTQDETTGTLQKHWLLPFNQDSPTSWEEIVSD